MKTSILLFLTGLLIFLSGYIIHAQEPTLEWVKQMGGIGNDRGNVIALDTFGNIITAGYFEGSVDFDPGAGVNILSPVWDHDMYVQKLDSEGNLIWVRQISGTDYIRPNSIAVDQSGNVYLTGVFDGMVDFDPGTASFELINPDFHFNTFVLKLSAEGDFEWANHLSGLEINEANSIALDNNNNVYLTGFFDGTVDFDPGIGTYYYTAISLGCWDTYILKLNVFGDLVWVKHMGGMHCLFGESITTDHLGNVYTTGWFGGVADFDPGPDSLILDSDDKNDIFIHKLDSLGDFVWAKQIGGMYSARGHAITADDSVYIYVTGFFQKITDFDPGPDTFNIGSSQNFGLHIFVLKLNTSGSFIWAKQVEGEYDEGSAYSITLDRVGNVYTRGEIEGGSGDFDPGPDTFNIGEDMDFILKLNAQGEFCWAIPFDYDNARSDKSIVVDNMFDIYVTGSFGDTVDFDPGIATQNLISNGEQRDIFILKLNQCGFLSSISSSGDTHICQGESLTLTANGGDSYLWSTGDTTASINVSPFETTNYSVNVSDNSCFCGVDTIQVTVESLPNAQFDYEVNGNSVNFLNLSSSNATGFQWNFGDSSPESNEENPTHTYSQPGVYLVTLVVSNEFCGSAISQNVAVLPTSTKTIDHKKLIEIFPNPVNDMLTIKSEVNIDGIQISNVLGKNVINLNQLNSFKKIDISNLTPGIYMISFTFNNKIWTTEFVKQ